MTDTVTVAQLLTDAYQRIAEVVEDAVAGLTRQQLTYRPEAEANTIGWLVWHLTRVQDDHVADAAGHEQVWTAQDWVSKFGLPFDKSATGYGQDAADVAAVTVEAQLLLDYHAAVLAKSIEYLFGLTEADLGRIVDTNWNPPVTLGARLVSVLSDDLQHAGQAAYLRGLLPA